MGVKSRIKSCFKIFQKEVKTPVYIPVFSGDILSGKTALITGGAGGIGKAIAEACLKNGASVILTGRDTKKLLRVIGSLEKERIVKKQKVIPLLLDIQNINSIKPSIYKVIKENSIDKIDILVNNAGVAEGQSMGETTEKDFDKTMDINLKGTYFMAQEFSNYLLENKIQGNILNVSSVSGIRPVITPYMLSKWGITGLTAGLAKKLIRHGIVVNGIAPGPTATNMLGLDGSNLFYENSPAKRYVDPAEVANLAIFLISDMGKMIVGDTVYITGGCGNLTVDDIEY